jgi:alkylation response protein AidB-like acyl-CoA dehydrogenase
MGAPLLADPARTLANTGLAAALEEVVTLVDARCTAVDEAVADLRPTIEALGRHGLVSLGTTRGVGTLGDQASVLAALAERCMASAFTAWAHRMTIEYLDVIGTPAAALLAEPLHTGARLGSTAMADAFRDLAGIAPLPLTFRRTGTGVVIDGVVAWASNLQPGSLVVTAARDGDVEDPATADRLVVALTVGQDGLTVRPATELLALDATASGSLRLDGVVVDDRHVLTDDVTGFLRRVRPAFLVLQTSFCLGLVRACVGAVPEPRGVGESFADDLEALRHRAERAWAELASLADGAAEAGVAIRPYLQARLAAAHLARDATHLELCLTGGRGYAHASPTARRLREAAFLPVQSPTEGQLRWELSRSA